MPVAQRTYLGVSLSKKESEWVQWYNQGTNDWWNAFFQYKHRKRTMRSEEVAKSWFNRVLKKLKAKGLFQHVPFAFIQESGVHWVHPGFQNDGYVAVVGEENDPALLSYQKPIV